MEYRYGSHTVFKIEYHFVWATKYRYPVWGSNTNGEKTYAKEFQPNLTV
jgi:REP element-mobilizing transposase RayT